MGYRLEFKDPNKDELLDSCGGKLYGYIEYDDLKECKSWNWMKENGFFNSSDGMYDEEYAEMWDYGAYHTMYLTKDQFHEFITLYIEDRNKFWFNDSEYKDSLENYYDALKLNVIKCEWW